MRALLMSFGALLASGIVLLLGAVVYFAVGALARERPPIQPGISHPSLDRESCIECHAPIAAEWRRSFHFRSVTGPFWGRVRAKGFADVFEALRVPCMNCHAPANVTDLTGGRHPVQRIEAPEMGVDCVSCHVSERGIIGPGHERPAPHEVINDERFRNPARASATLCAACHEEDAEHARLVSAWQETPFARDGVTCLHCHMPSVEAPSVTGGPRRSRRSHAFLGDKDEEMLREALNASILLSNGHRAIVRITNDRVGHSLPGGGMNALIVRVTVRADDGRTVAELERSFGSQEWIPGYLDFWPFLKVTKIPYGETRDITVDVPAGHGEVSAEFRYRDWFTVADRDTVFAQRSRRY